MDYHSLLAGQLFVRTPDPARWAVTRPEDGRRALPAFPTEAGARAFWAAATPGRPHEIAALPFTELARLAEPVGALVIDPLGEAPQLIERAELKLLSLGEVPGAFAAWLREPARLSRRPGEVLEAVRQTHLLTLVGPGAGPEQRLYLLGKSEDGSLAVPGFSDAESLARFIQIRRIEGGYSAALYSGAELERIAVGLGAVLLLDPETPWETEVTPSLFGRLQ